MAKIGDLVKTYRLLNDPKAPDWNIKFAGAVIIALTLAAGAAALVWTATHDTPIGPDAPGGVAATEEEPDGAEDCLAIDPNAPHAPGEIPAACATPPAP